jgi:hypothetical protein
MLQTTFPQDEALELHHLLCGRFVLDGEEDFSKRATTASFYT